MTHLQLSHATVLTHRLSRQRLTNPVDLPDQYLDLFAQLQPVSPIYNTRPGDPPRLVHRTAFDDGAIADQLRGQRVIVKGRFQGGGIGYVSANDLGLYATAFRRPLDRTRLTRNQQTVYDCVREAGPLTAHQIKDETHLPSKEIMPALQRLQEAFLVYEDQVDNDWERGWYDFATEWPDVDLEALSWPAAAGAVVRRFLRGHVFATFEQIKEWSQFGSKPLTGLLEELQRSGIVVPATVDDVGDGWIVIEDRPVLQQPTPVPPPAVFMLHRGDVLVRAQATELKRRFAGAEILQYLLIDGEFVGAVSGHWRIGPRDVDDILVHLPTELQQLRQTEIIAAVAEVYHPPDSLILRYTGKQIAS